MRTLSKTRLLSYRQCPRRLWLEIHRPDLNEVAPGTQARFTVGHQVGDLARRRYDPDSKGTLIDVQADGYDEAVRRSTELLRDASAPIFEACFRIDGALAFADVMLPVKVGRRRAWRMIEVKSATQAKDYHRDDVAIQGFVAAGAGVPLASLSLAHIDSSWTYPGSDDYTGLLVEQDLTEDATTRAKDVQGWLADAHKVAARRTPPATKTGKQCSDPFDCGFLAHCRSLEPQAEFPLRWLPGRQNKAMAAYVAQHDIIDLREVPAELLNEQQLRVKTVTVSNRRVFDRKRAQEALAAHRLPAYFMDFETTQFAVPIWKGTRPYQQIPFQFSVHWLGSTGKLDERAFLDLSGNDPSRAFAEALIAACDAKGPIFVYNAGFETARVRELAARFPRLASALLAINERVVDLHPLARAHVYHPSQQGSWSLKAVLPALCPDLDYASLEGVQHGGAAMEAYAEAITPTTAAARKEELDRQLLAYCSMDTYALVRLWEKFSGTAIRVDRDAPRPWKRFH